MNKKKFNRWLLSKNFWKQTIFGVIVASLILAGAGMLWITTLRIPDLQSFQEKVLASSTKIYDRTGEILLYDLNKDVRREVIPFDQISQHAKNATIAIEDDKFYEHKGIALVSIMRAIVVDIQKMSLSQGGSTITQQVIKNSLLTTDKKFSRKIKEWVLALKLERIMSKDEILNLYLNSTPYGGSYYGIESASKSFFGKSAKDLTIAESAYMAALPQAPTYYSPYGNHRDALDSRKNLVLQKMKESGYISEQEFTEARAERVVFVPAANQNIKAPHFVMFTRENLIEKYGEDMVNNGGLKVITTLDFELQQKAEEITLEYALKNKEKFNAENAATVVIDPTTGQILSMVGSRDYFDKNIDGNFNVTLAARQPGSAFKPFAYATAFGKGYTPDTVLFDLPTQFSTTCSSNGIPNYEGASCYQPQNYDGQFLGPMTLRNALAQSRNIPAIKTLYLAGMNDTMKTAQAMGITTLSKSGDYGLTLVLGGGEVTLLDMTSAYSTFANNGNRNPYTGILKITDKKNKILEEFTPNSSQVIPEQSALLINNILSDNNARLALNGPGAPTDFPADKEIALKTGTTDDYHDVWILGYTPHIAVGAWAGNNDNRAMQKKSSGLIISPLWRALMNEALLKYPSVPFKRPEPTDPTLRPILRGVWQGGQVYTIDKTSGKLATDATPIELRQDIASPDIHTILYWINKSNPKGPPPANPQGDSQFELWETPIRAWAAAHSADFGAFQAPTEYDDTHTPDAIPKVAIINPSEGSSHDKFEKIIVSIESQSKFPIEKVDFYINNKLIGTANGNNPVFSFVPNEVGAVNSNILRVVAYDNARNKGETQVTFSVR